MAFMEKEEDCIISCSKNEMCSFYKVGSLLCFEMCTLCSFVQILQGLTCTSIRYIKVILFAKPTSVLVLLQFVVNVELFNKRPMRLFINIYDLILDLYTLFAVPQCRGREDANDVLSPALLCPKVG